MIDFIFSFVKTMNSSENMKQGDIVCVVVCTYVDNKKVLEWKGLYEVSDMYEESLLSILKMDRLQEKRIVLIKRK